MIILCIKCKNLSVTKKFYGIFFVCVFERRAHEGGNSFFIYFNWSLSLILFLTITGAYISLFHSLISCQMKKHRRRKKKLKGNLIREGTKIKKKWKNVADMVWEKIWRRNVETINHKEKKGYVQQQRRQQQQQQWNAFKKP